MLNFFKTPCARRLAVAPAGLYIRPSNIFMKPILSFFLLLLIATGCKRDVEIYTSETLADYLPLATGKYIIYQLDSTVFTGFGRVEEIHHYQEKQEVAALLTDNRGNASYVLQRHLRDSAGLGAWQAAGNYMITPLENTVEVIENNFRTVRLALPVKRDYSWRGNQHLPFAPYGAVFDFRSDTNFDLSDWDFYYEAPAETILLNGQAINNIITVKHIDEETMSNADIFLTGKTYSEDKYAKGIGLVYQELLMWEREPNVGGSSAFNIGFGVKRTMIEHN